MAIIKGEFSLIVKLLSGIVAGALLGMLLGANADADLVKSCMNVVVSLKHLFGEIIFFLVPLVIVGFITPAIIRLGENASKMLFVAVALAYISSLAGALFSMTSGYIIIPHLSVATSADALRQLPDIIFRLDIPPMFSVMTALVLALFFGVAVALTGSGTMARLFAELERVVSVLINIILIPLLPFFVGLCFLSLAFEGLLSIHLPVFISMVLIAICGHFIWLAVLYGIAGIISGRSPVEVFRHYLPAYLTAVGTMSSAATLPVALRCARKSAVLSRTMTEFMIPLGATVHLCGSVITETFFVMTLHLMLYGALPSLGTMLIFCVLLAVFAVGAPGVPGGTVVASLGIVTGVLGFDANGVALLIAIFALQDSFGTACNVTGDGALALMMEGLFNKNGELGPLQGEEADDTDAAGEKAQDTKQA